MYQISLAGIFLKTLSSFKQRQKQTWFVDQVKSEDEAGNADSADSHVKVILHAWHVAWSLRCAF